MGYEPKWMKEDKELTRINEIQFNGQQVDDLRFALKRAYAYIDRLHARSRDIRDGY